MIEQKILENYLIYKTCSKKIRLMAFKCLKQYNFGKRYF